MIKYAYITVDKEPLGAGYRADVYCPVQGFIESTGLHPCPIDAADEAIRIACREYFSISGICKGKGW